MRFLPLVLANLLRKKLRTLLTVGSFVVALFLFGLLAAIRGAFTQGVEVAGVDRLVVINRVSLIQPLPLAYRDRLLRIPGVRHVTYASWFGGVYQDEKHFFPQFAVEPASFGPMFPEFVVPEAEWRAFLADRQGCVAGEALARRFGWRVGDRIPIRGSIYQGVWEFNLRGIYRGTRPQDDTTQFWFQSDYLQERAASFFRGYVGWYWIRIADPDAAPAVVAAIDAEFANSPWETRTQTESAFAAGFVRQMGNVELILLSVGGVVFFTLLLVTANTMAIAVRERTNELAVLKAIGYADGTVLAIVLGEALVMAGVGGGSGLALAKAFTLRGDPTGGLLPVFFVSASQLAAGLALALGMGVLAALLPAVGAMRLRVAEALGRV